MPIRNLILCRLLDDRYGRVFESSGHSKTLMSHAVSGRRHSSCPANCVDVTATLSFIV
jgi:hypothetical protein